VAAAFLSAIPVLTCSNLWVFPPHSRYMAIRFEWTWGIYATWILGVLAIVTSALFGGKPSEIPAPDAPNELPRPTIH
jgi:hypothetical protein